MNELSRGRLAIKYIIFEILPVFVLGMTVFILVLIMFQSFKLSEYVIVHGAPLQTVLKLILFMMLGYLPILFPIALLFAVLLVYGRLSGDSEIVALKALGLSSVHIAAPVIAVGIAVSLFSLQTSFRLAPWGQRRLSQLISVLAQTKPTAAIREGVFSEGFFDLVIYANKADSKSGKLQKIFIFDERDPKSPVTVIANQGEIVNTNSITGAAAFLRLFSGSVHKSTQESYTKINFNSYDINLFDPHDIKEEATSVNAMDLSQLRQALKEPEIKEKDKIDLLLELHRRWSLASACLIFAFLGVSLGAVTNRRTARSGSLVICISAIVVYWGISVGFEAVARGGHLAPSVTSWLPNLCFLIFSLFQFRNVTQS